MTSASKLIGSLSAATDAASSIWSRVLRYKIFGGSARITWLVITILIGLIVMLSMQIHGVPISGNVSTGLSLSGLEDWQIAAKTAKPNPWPKHLLIGVPASEILGRDQAKPVRTGVEK